MRIVAIAFTLAASVAAGESFRFEAEDGVISSANSTNTRVTASAPGYSGSGYVTGFPNQDAFVDRLSISATLPEGLYDLVIGYRSPFGNKGYDLSVGASAGSGMFSQSTAFAQETAGQYYVDSNPLSLQLSEGWGYYDVDYFEFRSAEVRRPLPVAPVLSNPAASVNAKFLMSYLASNYGSQTLFGQQRENGNPDPVFSAGVLNHTGGIVPAIAGGDLMRYSPSRVERGENPNGESERLVNWAKQSGGIVSLMWHWNAPSGLIDQPGQEWWRGFYTDSTTFNLGTALANPTSPEYGLLLRDIDVMAGELQKFKQADIPVLWRPLHEAQGNDSGAWFWWGNSGPDALKELWSLMHDRMTNFHGLDNLIWVSTAQVDASDWQEWYPGDEVVDIVGVDVYSQAGDNMTGQWAELLEEFDGEKLIALTETGALPPEEVLERYGVAFSYMMPWNEQFLTQNHTPAEVQQIVGDDDVLDLSELMPMPWAELAEPAVPGDFDRNGAVDDADLAVWQFQYGLTGPVAADGNGDGVVNAADYAIWRDHLGAQAEAVPEPAAIAPAILAIVAALVRRRHSPNSSM